MKKNKPTFIRIISIITFALAIGIGAMALPGCDIRSQEKKQAHAEDGHSSEVHSKDAHPENGHPEPDHETHGNADVHEDEGSDEDEDLHDEEVVILSSAQLKEFGIELAKAGEDSLDQYVELPGEIVINADRLAHVVPRVSGVVREVRKTVGDTVESGELLAVLESRELATAKAAFLAAIERETLAMANFEREERLWKKQVTSEQEYLDARRALAETRIEKDSAEQQLHALGLSDSYLKKLPQHPDAAYTCFEIRAPFAGTIIEKHLTLGEKVNDDAEVFTIADLSTVWVDVNVYQKDLAAIARGQAVTIEIGHGIPSVNGTIAWVSPLVNEASRTAKARVVLPNPDDNLRPGFFITARVAVGSAASGIIIPKSALQTFEEKTVVFIRSEKGFEPHPVTLGRENTDRVEILAGLQAGQTYVSRGAFTLKAQLSKSAFGDGHNH